MRFGSLFAGIGGFDLGLERAGMECAWQVEIDDYCTKVLEKHWPDVKRYRDIKDVDGKEIESVELICGGFPCQPYSNAGKRKGAQDDRNLWPEYLRIIREARPKWVIAENVPGIVKMYLDQVLSDLEGEGYTCWTFNIPAVAINAPHRRERIFIVANSDQPGLAEWEGKQKDNGAKQQTTIRASWWTAEPELGRVADGIPDRVDRIKALGNAVVPQVVEWIGLRILECY